MNPIFFSTILCLTAFVSGSTIIDESNWNLAELAMLSPAERWGTPVEASNSWGAPIGSGGQVVDTPEVAAAKTAHYAARPSNSWNAAPKAAWSSPSARSWSPSPNSWSNHGTPSWAPANSWSHGSARYAPKPSYHGYGHSHWY